MASIKGLGFPPFFLQINRAQQTQATKSRLWETIFPQFLKFAVFLKRLAGQFFADVTLCHYKPVSGHATFSSFGFASSGCHQQQNGRFLLCTQFCKNLPVDVFRVLSPQPFLTSTFSRVTATEFVTWNFCVIRVSLTLSRWCRCICRTWRSFFH